MMKSFKNKTAVVTGAAAGIGQATAIAFAEAGADLAVNDVADLGPTLDKLKKFGVKVYSEKTDMGDKKSIKRFHDNVMKEFASVDILINNAGIALGDLTFEEITDEDFEKITNINYWGVIYTTHLFYKHMLTRPEAAVANISSTQGILALPYLIPYCTTKFAVRGFTDTLRTEHEVRGIKNFTVHTVHPGAVATDITINADYHGSNTGTFHEMLQKRGVSPQSAAKTILDGIRKGKGRIFISDGWAHDLIARTIPESSHNVVKAFLKLQSTEIR